MGKPPETDRPSGESSPQPSPPKPPEGWTQSVRFLGPGLIVVGAVVGSGELIATTLLGAQAGFLLLWLVILSCLVKVVLQEQLAYYVITSGGTLLDAFEVLPGPRIRGVSWLTWLFLTYLSLSVLSLGGIVGMSAVTASLIAGRGNLTMWVISIGFVTAAFFRGGSYGRIERLFTVLVGTFSACQIIALFLIQRTEYTIGWADLTSGLGLDFPPEGAYIALAVFGVTGLSATELAYYTYWCLEKGYGRYIGPPDGSSQWEDRARKWISVMRKDVLLTAIIYTTITVAFYLLGAAILHRTQADLLQLEGLATARALSDIFTRSFGAWSYYLFMGGAFLVLFSTYLASCASIPRIAVNFLERVGLISDQSPSGRNRWLNRCSVFIAFAGVAIYLVSQAPVALILFFGGFLGSLFLPLMGIVPLYLSRSRSPGQLKPGRLIHSLLWVCTILILTVLCASLYLLI